MQTTKIIFSHEPLDMKEATRNILESFTKRGLLHGFEEVQGVYMHQHGHTVNEASWLCILNFKKEDKALMALLSLAFQELGQESVLMIDHTGKTKLVFTDKVQHLGYIKPITGDLPANYTKRADGTVWGI